MNNLHSIFMKSLFEEQAYAEIKTRVANIDETSKANWGKMNPGQMLHHCQGPLNIMLCKNDYNLKPNFLFRMFRKSLYDDKPWKKGLPTARPFRVVEDKELPFEKKQLLHLIDEAYNQKDKTEWEPHPVFGKFTRDQWGKIQYKHLDHHLKQFGV